MKINIYYLDGTTLKTRKKILAKLNDFIYKIKS